MTELIQLLGILLAAVWIESLALAFGIGWLLRGAAEAKQRHANGLIRELEDAMAGNGRALLENERALHLVAGWLEFIRSSLEAEQEHMNVTRRVLGRVRGRPFDGSDRDHQEE